jgi:hypothetical protein
MISDVGMVRSKRKNQRDPLPEHFRTAEEAAEFWDTHDSSKYDEYFKDVECEVAIKHQVYEVEVDGDLFRRVSRIARQQRLSPERLIDRWLREKAS